jgi:GTP-dependent phosphoenolpyruvate carboxykinase
MSNYKQTAVEWLIEKLTNRQNGVFDGFPYLSVDEIYEQAKEMEKEQIEEAYKYARAHWSREDGNAERYYEQTYGGNK